MHYIILFLFTCQALLATQTIHSSVSVFAESSEFSNSKQKTQGKLYGAQGDIHLDAHEIRAGFEEAHTHTKQPPLREDLHTQKLFLRYGYALSEAWSFNLNTLYVAKDNIAPTEHAKAYGAGVTFVPHKKLSLNLTQFHVDYGTFHTRQSDVQLDFKTRIDEVRLKLTSLTHYIAMEDYTHDPFSKNADKNYLSSALKLHLHYKTYHLGAAAYMGKRLFAVMDEGMKIQHHAMEFDRTYAAGLGKDFGNFTVRLQHVYQRAEEIPMQNKNVTVRNTKAIVNYRF
jgi:hypothetical protein